MVSSLSAGFTKFLLKKGSKPTRENRFTPIVRMDKPTKAKNRRTEMMGENSQLGSPLMENHFQTADTVEILWIWAIFRGILREGFRDGGCGFRDFQRDSPYLSDFQRDFGRGTRRSNLETRLLHYFGGLKAEADWMPLTAKVKEIGYRGCGTLAPKTRGGTRK
ncbi:hypothetical protein U1Q18_028083 [Sarracenia purpurea var. burkii]